MRTGGCTGSSQRGLGEGPTEGLAFTWLLEISLTMPLRRENLTKPAINDIHTFNPIIKQRMTRISRSQCTEQKKKVPSQYCAVVNRDILETRILQVDNINTQTTTSSRSPHMITFNKKKMSTKKIRKYELTFPTTSSSTSCLHGVIN